VGSALRADTQAGGWELVSVKDGITTHRREVPGSPVVAIRGEGIVDAPILRVASVIMDTRRESEWTDALVEVRRLRTFDKLHYVEYTHIGMPAVLSDREFVVETRVQIDAARKQITFQMRSVRDPGEPTTKLVRGDLMQSNYLLTSLDHGTRTRMVADVHADPKGSVPSWIVNLFQKSWAHTTITRLRAQVRKPDVHDDEALAKLLVQAGLTETAP